MFDFVTWIAPKNVVLNQVFGCEHPSSLGCPSTARARSDVAIISSVQSGLGLSFITFDCSSSRALLSASWRADC